MPIYEFECSKCQQITEALLKFSDQPLTVCPKCGGSLSKLMSMNSFQLKGGGWYATDYAKKSETNSHSSPAKPVEKATDSPSTSGTDTTAAKKAEPAKEA
ncbi:MAG: zinc ribbon domain-containing protein [Deltaproteobacteria bacterium]|jgi:putative FmdB family regulatory protein|nr:zinc ribbon domain-containing protein [Deltaproteobacteria bacterium]